MASKQLGKLRQWAGEVISLRDKTSVSDEFAELEKDIELRREGAAKLLAASGAYQHALSKKKKNEAFADAEKTLPVDTLGMVMILHGEEFGDDSGFGTSLVKLGRAHCKVATLQESYAIAFKDTFIASMEKFTNRVKEYDAQRKKLDSRRLSYDAAVAKLEKLKGGKKEKERKEAEDEMDKAKLRYEEASDEVQAFMHAIQDNEILQLRELDSFLELETNFVEQYLTVLKDVKSEWHTDSSNVFYSPVSRTARPAHVFRLSGPIPSKQLESPNGRANSESSDDDSAPRSNGSRKSSFRKRSRTSSRSTSRKRSDSVGTAGDKDEKDKDKTRRMSVTGWASNAVESVTGRSRKGRDKFTSLGDDEVQKGDEDEKGSPSRRFQSISRKLSRDKPQTRILKPQALQDKKIARALYAFNGGNEELSFDVGDEITVVNEVLDGWWMGELRGERGLFPTSLVEVVILKPTLTNRPMGKDSSPSSYEEHAKKGLIDNDSLYMSSDIDDDRDLTKQPLSPNHHNGPFYGDIIPDTASITSSFADDDDDKSFAPSSHDHRDIDGYTFVPASSQSESSSARSEERAVPLLPTRLVAISSPAARKGPPPPPPRRPPATAPPTPAIPVRPLRVQSSKSLTPPSSVGSHGYDRSPFESVADLQTVKGCGNFKQKPFRTQGMCANCLQFHG